MAETKTFMNPNLVVGFEEGERKWHSISTYPSPGKFHVDEWDMEVTFTRKPVKPEVGGTCKTAPYGDTYVIRAVSGDFVWVVDIEDLEDQGYIHDIRSLVDVKPWQPA